MELKNLKNKEIIINGLIINDENLYFVYKEDNYKAILIDENKDIKIINDINDMKLNNSNCLYKKPLGYLKTKINITENIEELNINCYIFDITYNKKTNTIETFIKNEDRFYELDCQSFYDNLNINIWVPDEVIVHDGKMHADDIFSVALLKYINKNITYKRTRNIPENFKGVVADLGNGRYDHHNMDKPRITINGNEVNTINGEKSMYASFGLLAKDILPGIIGENGYFTIDANFIKSLDDYDNYGVYSDLGYAFQTFNADNKNGFDNAVNFALSIISQIIEIELNRQNAIPYVLNCLKNMKNGILIMDKMLPWKGMAKKHKAKYALYPNSNNEIVLQCVDSNNKNTLFPEKWIDNKPIGMIFCHKGLHFATFDNLENALLATKELI